MNGPVLAILLTFVVHVVGMGVLISLMGHEVIDMFRSRPRREGGDGGEPAPDPVPAPTPSGGGLPLPDAVQTAVRLREPGRLADGYDRPARRPEHEPVRTPQRERV